MYFISNNIIVILLLVLGVAAGWIWHMLPEPTAPGQLPLAAEKWVMPAEVEPDFEEAVDTIATRNVWGTVVAAKDISLNDPEWRIAGVIMNDPEKFVLIKKDAEPAELLKVGDTLPGGSKILKISEDSLCILVNGKRRKLETYRR